MIQKNQLVPDIAITDLAGQIHRLWEFRQKTHLLILFGEGADRAGDALAEKKKIMDWLGLRVIACGAPPDGFSAGAVAIDRFGRLMETYPLTDDLADRVEKDLIYYEARHC